MSQPIKRNIAKELPKKKKKKLQTTHAAKVREIRKKMKGNQEFGTSKLEERFANDFLDKLGLKYTYQYKAASIGRYFDFYLDDYRVLLEIDGDYYHSFGLLYEEMSPMQKRNKRVDEQKDHWARINGIPLIRIWEHDINKHPEKVLTMLKEKLHLYKEKNDKLDNKKKRH